MGTAETGMPEVPADAFSKVFPLCAFSPWIWAQSGWTPGASCWAWMQGRWSGTGPRCCLSVREQRGEYIVSRHNRCSRTCVCVCACVSAQITGCNGETRRASSCQWKHVFPLNSTFSPFGVMRPFDLRIGDSQQWISHVSHSVGLFKRMQVHKDVGCLWASTGGRGGTTEYSTKLVKISHLC